MRSALSKTRTVLGVLALGGTLNSAPPWSMAHRETSFQRTSQRILMIRVSQESSPGAGDFDTHILGFIQALQSTGEAADFYMYGKAGPNYGNTQPALSSNTSHILFVNASDGLSLFVVQNNSNHAEMGDDGGVAFTRWELSGGTASILIADDGLGEADESNHGTVFTTNMDWAQSNTDGMVVGALPVGFTILGQFTLPPKGLGGGWEVISADGTKIPLNLVVGQRVRLDVALQVKVRQDH